MHPRGAAQTFETNLHGKLTQQLQQHQLRNE